MSPSPSTTTRCAAAALAWLTGLTVLAAAPAWAALSLTVNADLNFGRFVAASGGKVTVSTAGKRSRSGGVVLLPSPVSAAGFSAIDNNPGTGAGTGAGTGSDILILTLPGNGSVSLRAGPHSMALSAFTSNRPSGGVLGRGAQSYTIGATLQVAPAQPAGNYSGAIPLIVEYQ